MHAPSPPPMEVHTSKIDMYFHEFLFVNILGEVDAAMSAPASPRKRNNSLQNSPQRPSGYVPASHYKSSYRSKQYPTFPQNPGIGKFHF